MAQEPASSLPESARPSSRLLWLLGGFALALRLFDLGRRELWVDEGITWFFAQKLGHLELGQGLAELIRLEPTPPLYYGLIGLLLRLGGDSDLLMRLPSAVSGAFAAPLLVVLGGRLGWLRAGWTAGVLIALHPWHLFLSREARVYPLLLTLVLLLAISLWQALESGQRRPYLQVGVWLTLCLYCHLFGLFVGAAVALLVVVLAKDAASRRRGLVAVAVALLLFLPYLGVALPALAGSGANWSQELLYAALPEESGLPRIVEGQLVGARYHLLQRELAQPETPPLLRWPAVASQLVLLVAALGWLGREKGKPRRALIFVATLYLLPFFLPWVAGLASGKVFFQPGRHDFLVLGPLCLLLAAGWQALRERQRFLAYLLLALILPGLLFRLAWLHLLPAGGTAMPRGEFLARAAAPGDLAIAFGIERLLGERYTRLAGGALPIESFPEETDHHPGWSDPRPLLARLPQLREEARARLLKAGPGRVFTLERYAEENARNSPGWEVDATFLQALREQGWQVESSDSTLGVRIWRRP